MPSEEAVAAAASAYGVMFEKVAGGADGGWSRHVDGLSTMVTGFDDPMLNAVLAVGTGIGPDVVSGALAAVAETGLPYCLETREGTGAAIARDLEMTAAAEVPFMLLEGAAALADRGVPELEVRALDEDEIGFHLDCLAAAVSAPREYFDPLRSGRLLRQDGVTGYVGVVGGGVVCTGVGIVVEGFVGVINMGTPELHRGRGYAAAVTARIVRDGFTGGASAAVLQPSALGRPVYERLGFRVVEQWTVWLPPEA